MLTRHRKTLVCIFQRGGMDGLMAVTPFTDSSLPTLRPKLMLPLPGSGAARAMLGLDGTFALHPALAPLLPFYRDGRLAIVHGVGSPEKTRSHFDQQEYMETGTPGHKGTRSGWLNRALALMKDEGRTPFRAVASATALPRALYGDETALAIPHLPGFGLQVASAHEAVAAVRSGLDRLYRATPHALLGGAGSESFAAVDMLAAVGLVSAHPANEAEYPERYPVGNSLRQIAQLIKADVGLTVACVESATADWDTHANQHGALGSFSRQADGLARSIAAFYTDLGSVGDNVVVLTMTEFGRTVAQNGSSGTDHGRASCFFVLGKQVEGGRVYGRLPPLEPDALEDGRDLPVTTDFRAVFAAVAAAHLGVTDCGSLFPGWDGAPLPLFKS